MVNRKGSAGAIPAAGSETRRPPELVDAQCPIPGWLAAEFPFTPRILRLSAGAHMAFLDEGSHQGRAVLMLHGNPTWSFFYHNLVRTLAPSARCIAPDHIGMGLSDKPPHHDYSLAGRIADLESLVAALGLRRLDLVVHDWGGAVGCGLAARHPGLIDRLVILNTAAFISTRLPARIAACRVPLLGPLLVRGANLFAWPATWMAMHRRTLTPLQRRAYLHPYDSWEHRVGIDAFVQDIPMRPSHPSWPTLREIERYLPRLRDRPALIVWGGRDFCFNDHFLARWREILPEAQTKRIADAGHYVLEDAGDQAIRLISDFLRQ